MAAGECPGREGICRQRKWRGKMVLWRRVRNDGPLSIGIAKDLGFTVEIAEGLDSRISAGVIKGPRIEWKGVVAEVDWRKEL